ncbi:sodium channel protein Nach-like [Colletes gigas]|uniref:sodium channel protein Nach-like n=1 Tax=Colletes gigas TaxID=935657 RepID=UPI001C9A4018|nr:sodium channel protein Nach-like [Colletes gigas]
MVKELATEIYNANISNLSLDETLEVLWTLGDFYETSNAKADNYTQLTQLLSKFYDNDYDIAELMMRLTPDCSAMLVLCYFQNEKQNCSDIFTVSQTETGFCCTFNYIPERYDSPTISFSPRRVEHVGKTSGLTLMLDPLMDDYFYPIISTTGWKVMVFDPYDYPDTTTGGVVELLLSPLNDKYVELDALGLHSSENIRSYPIEKRGCYFPNERPSISAIYTASDCIVACKVADIWKSCKCRPFFYNPRPTEQIDAKNEEIEVMPISVDILIAIERISGWKQFYFVPNKSYNYYSIGHSGSNRTCTMEDIPCLREYKYYTLFLNSDKRLSIVPYPERTLNSLVNNNQTLYCKNCYPSCDEIFYLAKSTVFELRSGYFKTTLLDNVNVTNHSILRVYFGKVGTAYLKQDESYRWYEYLSDAGGICGFFVGFSLTSVIEIVYFSVLFLLEIFNPKTDPETAGEDENPHNQLSIQAVYWNELFPRSRIREQ